MMAFLRAGMPSGAVYRISPVLRREVQLMTASMGALDLGSPPPRWMTGSPFSRRRAAVSFSLRVADSLMERASWLRLIRFVSFLAYIKLKFCELVVLVITS